MYGEGELFYADSLTLLSSLEAVAEDFLFACNELDSSSYDHFLLRCVAYQIPLVNNVKIHAMNYKTMNFSLEMFLTRNFVNANVDSMSFCACSYTKIISACNPSLVLLPEITSCVKCVKSKI